MDEIYREFASLGVPRGNELYVPKEIIPFFLQRSSEEGLAVIGIEAFVIRPDATVPLPYILDLSSLPRSSWQEYLKATQEECDSFLVTLPDIPGLHVTFSVFGPHE